MAGDLRSEIYGLLESRFRAAAPGELRDDLDLGPPGFGLDSISLVELLLACEERFEVAFPFTLFDEGPITVGRLARHAADARSRAGHGP